MASSRALGALVLCGCLCGCRRPGARPATALPVFVDRSPVGRLIPLPEGGPSPDPAPPRYVFVDASHPGEVELPTATVEQPLTLPGQQVVPVPPAQGPPPDGVAAALTSLRPEARATAPDPATLPFYDVQLRVDPDEGRLTGHETIDYPNRTTATLHELPLRIFANGAGDLVNVDGVSELGAPLAVGASEPTVVRVTLAAPLAPGGWAHLDVTFHGQAPEPRPDTGQAGMLQSLLAAPGRSPDYGLFSRFTDGVALAEFLPMVAGRWQGGFDLDPGNGIGDSSYFDLSSFRASIDLPADDVLAAPGVTLGEEFLPGRRKRTEMALADARDLAFFVSARYREADTVQDGIRVRSLYENGEGDPGQSVLDTARKALALFGRLWHDYPWATFTAVEVPLRGGAGGAEFPSLVAVAGMVYGEGGLPGGMQFSPTFLGEMREFVVAHETAHQWWACSVASQPRAQPDVDEPLAQYSAGVYVGAEHGAEARKAVLGSQVAVNYQAIRMLGISDGPAARATSDFQNTGEYAGLVYGKAPFFYQALEDRLGAPGVARGLALYARQHWMGLARRGDVVAAMASANYLSRGELQPLFDRWFREAHGDADMAGRGDVSAVAMEAFGGGGLDLGKLLDQAPQALQQ
ncbi:MAG TPA: hypothetical protein VMB50_13150, partial [Myxococcales bacterium]|nr:hypothetical protein [Myxococcales bacterium]